MKPLMAIYPDTGNAIIWVKGKGHVAYKARQRPDNKWETIYAKPRLVTTTPVDLGWAGEYEYEVQL